MYIITRYQYQKYKILGKELRIYQNDSNLIDGATLCLIIGKIVQSALKGMKMYFIKKAMAHQKNMNNICINV